MSLNLNDAGFWDEQSDYQKLAHGFTSVYAEQAWRAAGVPKGATVLDIACGPGALALSAARDGAQVLATDFSSGMVAAVLSHGVSNVDALVMDGQALDLPDGSFDAAFSIFGVMLFPDWRKGLAEMARVVRPGGIGCVASWKHPAGAAANLLLADRVAALFPEAEQPTPIEGMNHLRDPVRFEAALVEAGFGEVRIVEASNDYVVDAAALADPDRLFQFSPIWPGLDAVARMRVTTSIEVQLLAEDGAIRVPSPALIAIGSRV